MGRLAIQAGACCQSPTFLSFLPRITSSAPRRNTGAVRFWEASKLPERLAYDHSEILDYALQRLQWKVQYTNVMWSLLPRKFTLSQLQNAYETVLNRALDKRNFRKKILSLGLVSPSGELSTGGRHRPAMLYRFETKRPEIVEVF